MKKTAMLALRAGVVLAASLAQIESDTALAQQPEIDKWLASDGEVLDKFGSSVALEGNVAVISSPMDDDFGNDCGSAYVRRFNGTAWVEEQKLTAADAAAGDHFGVSVDLSGTRVVVGADRCDGTGADEGAAYVFHFDGTSWVQEAKLTASDAAAYDKFGGAVAIDGDLIAVGSPGADLATGDEGAIYVFRRSALFGWLEQTKLTASDAATADQLGLAVSASGPVILAGSPEIFGGTGAVYFFRDQGGDNWLEEQKIPRPGDGYRYGTSLDLVGNQAVVGMPGDNTGATSGGAAFVYEYGGSSWTLSQQLLAHDPGSFDEFGHSVATDGTAIIVGAWQHDHPLTDSGTAYVFVAHQGVWAQDTELGATDADYWDNAGVDVAISGNRALVGVHNDGDLGQSSGSTYLYSVVEFTLTATPPAVNQGDLLTFVAAYDDPGESVLLTATAINGTPTFIVILLHIFNADHRFTLPVTVPGGLTGLDIDFQAWKFDAFSQVAGSTTASVQFQ